MASEWPVVPLGEVINLKRGYDLAATERKLGHVPIVSSSGLTGTHSKAMVAPPGVVTGRYGTIGLVHYVGTPFWPLNTTLYVQDFKGNDPRFVYYLLKTISYRDYLDKAAVPGINRNDVHRARVCLPPISEQRAISNAMLCLDERIGLLEEENKSSEQLARAIFQSWFVDFDPVRAKAEGREPQGMDTATAELFPGEFQLSPIGSIPKGWKVGTLGKELRAIETGSRPKGGVKDFIEGVPSVGAESIVGIGQFDFGKTKFVPVNFFLSMKKGHISDGDVLLYKDGGRPGVFIPHVTMVGSGFPFLQFCINEHVYRLRSRPGIPQAYLYFWLCSDLATDEMKNRGTGVAIPGLNSEAVRALPFLIADNDIFATFAHFAEPLVDKILLNSNKARTLALTRDTLLPRLISGKLRVPEAEKLVEAVL